MIILKTSKKLSLNLMKKLVKINHSLQKLHCLHQIQYNPLNNKNLIPPFFELMLSMFQNNQDKLFIF